MRFTPAALSGVFVVETDVSEDARGSFARAFCEREFAAAGLNTKWPQHNLSRNAKRGTLRGLHYQVPPHGEIKLIRCTAGAVYDVIVDLRPDSPTYLRWAATELSAANRRSLYVPAGFAHGAQTLADDTELFYQMSAAYEPEAAAGVRWNDGALGIACPKGFSMISLRQLDSLRLVSPTLLSKDVMGSKTLGGVER